MLEEIRISNFAIIEHLELTLGSGLNVITGETGAGKSIVIDAIELLLGGKVDASVIRSGADKAVIEGMFSANADTLPLIQAVLEEHDLLSDDDDDDDDEAFILTREIRRNGRSTARLNGVAVKAAILSEIGGYLVDIHGQSEHLSLLKPRIHIDLLDRYAGLMEMRSAMSSLVTKLNGLRDAIDALQHDKDELEARADRLRREVEEIETAALRPGEDDELRSERTRLANSEQLAKLTAEATLILDGDDEIEIPSVVDQLQQVALILDKLANIDEDIHEDAELAEALSDQVSELALSLRDYADEVEYDPVRLDEIEERLELINTLRRRYGVTIEHVLEHAEKAREDLENIENSDERLAELRADEDKLLHHIGELAERISAQRNQAGERLATQIETELQDLRMANARFSVQITHTENPDGCYMGSKRVQFDHTGVDDVEFMMTANPGEPLMPLAKVASGGETARIMLALKRALTLADPTDTLIFDEIDQGIGGRLGSVVGEKLWNLSSKHQVMVVTHLAQLAGFADTHFRVEKRIINERTSTHIERLDDDQRRALELAEMLGTVGESGEETARALLTSARGYKQEINIEP